MKTSRWIALFIVMLIVTSVVVATSQENDARPVVVKGYTGRYQLFQGTFFENRGIDAKGDFYSHWVEISN